MEEEIDRIRADCVRGFPITESEENKIKKIREDHKKDCPLCDFKREFDRKPISFS